MGSTKTEIRTDVNGIVDAVTDPPPYWAQTASVGSHRAIVQRKAALEKANAAWRARQEEKKKAEAARHRAALATPAEGEIPHLMKVRAGDVHLDRRYQTQERFQEWRVKFIAETWNWEECKPIRLNLRPEGPDGVLWCFDGQHRIAAAIMRFGPDVLLNAEAIRVPYEREAELFAEQHDNEKQVPKPNRFTALVEAGRPDALAQRAILEQLDLSVGRRAAPRTIALNAFLDCCTIKGLEATEEGLRFVLGAWHGATESLEKDVVKGVVWFVANRRDDPNYRAERVRTVLSRVSVGEIENLSGRKSPVMTKQQRIAAVIVDLYNAHRAIDLHLAYWHERKDK